MDGESNKDNNSSEIGSYDNEETSSHDVSEDHLIQNQQFFGTSGVQWSSSPKLPQNNYVEYLSESSASYLPNPMIHGNNYQTLGVGGSSSTFNDSGKAAFGFKLIDSSSNDFGIRKRVGFWRNDEGEEVIKAEIGSSQNLLCAEAHATWTPNSVGDKPNASRFDPMGLVSAPSLLPRSRGSSSKQKSEKTRYSDRQRRQRIADNLKALHELLPNPEVGSQAHILDDIIDYVNYLQIQIKELSGSKLQADTNAIPLVFHEGYGHYIKEQMLNEPLEEIMGKLVEEDSAAASQLLGNKGLILLPIALADDLNQAIQLWNQAS
ncbi:hypothetical protein P8452_08431 [Trifolium repens]|nr:hypothetical protein P8452_08431 [Trifolium repens]